MSSVLSAAETLPLLNTVAFVVRSDRRSVSAEVTRDGRLLVRAPLFLSNDRIAKFLKEKESWIASHLQKASEQNAQTLPPFTIEELRSAARKTRTLLADRLPLLAEQIGVTYGRVCVRTQHTRYGSCSSLGHLSFHACLSLMPSYVAEYVMIHELCHRKEMNHSAAFWTLVRSHCPCVAEAKAYLKKEGRELILRLPN